MTALERLALAVVFVFIAMTGATRADEDPRKEFPRLQATEFCAAVKLPPPILVEAINHAMSKDPAAWGPVVEWFNRIGERYMALKCGDS